MHVSWLGGTAVKIQTKPFDEEISIVIDPYKPESGAFPRSLTPHITLFTRGEDGSITLSGNPFLMSTPGECETKGVLITAAEGHSEGQTLLRVDAEGLSVGHLGRTNKELTDAQLEILSDVDILLVPVGGGAGYDAEQAVKVANAIEPRVIIPMAYTSDNDPKAHPVNAFLKAFGATNPAPEKKAIFKKKDLPVDETKVVVLAKE